MLSINKPKHSGLYNMIRKEYGLHVYKFLRVYIKSVKKISRTNEHIIFNQCCQRYKIIPKCLRARPSLVSQPFRLWRKGLVNCLQATCNSLQESRSLIRLQESSLIIFMEHKMASKRVEMLFAKKHCLIKTVARKWNCAIYTGDREVFVAWPGKVVSVRKIFHRPKSKLCRSFLTAVFYDSILL